MVRVIRTVGKAAAVTAFLAASVQVGCGADEPDRKPASMLQPMTATTPSEDEAPRANEAPVIETVKLEPSRPRAGDAVRADVEATDPDGDPVRLSYEWTVNGRELGETTNLVTLSGARKGAMLELRVVANDGLAESSPHRVATRIGNRPPKLDGVTIEPPGEIVGGEDVTVRPVAHDRDGDRLRFLYEWTVNGRRLREDGPVLPTGELRRGDLVRVRVQASDGEDRSNAIESPDLRVGNAPPRIVSRPTGAGADGVFRYRIEAVDDDGDSPLRYRLVSGPQGMTVSSGRGEIEWAPDEAQAGRHPVTLEVDDLHGGKVLHQFEVIVGLDAEEAESVPAAPR